MHQPWDCGLDLWLNWVIVASILHDLQAGNLQMPIYNLMKCSR